MRIAKPKFGRNEEDEGVRQKKKFDETLKQKKDMLKQEFEHLEEIRKYDEVAVQSLNEVKFKNELDKLFNIKRQKTSVLDSLTKNLEAIKLKNKKADEGSQSNLMNSTSQGFRSMVNNHHSDPLYSTFSKNLLAKNPLDLKEYVVQLETEDERYQLLVETEHGKTEALKINLEEIFKSKLKFQQEIEEFKLLNKVSQKRFGNMEVLNILAVGKNTISKKNLKTIKQELKEMQDMRMEYRKTQQEKQREFKKEIYVGEEYVSHNGMKIEEAIQKNIDYEKDILILEQDERKILEKRQKSHNILQYIAAFEMFEQIFMNKIHSEKVLGINGLAPRLVDKYEVIEELLKEQTNILDQELQDQNQNYSTTEVEMLADFDRNELINVINNFFTIHPQGVAFILQFMLEKLWQLKTELLQNNQTYETQLREKTKLVNTLEILDHDYQDLLEKNAYIQQDEDNSKNTYEDKRQELLAEVAQIEGVVDPKTEVAYDAGLFVSHITRGENEKQSITTTINIFKLELDEMTQIETMASKNLKCQNLLFNFFLSFSEFLFRQAQTLQIVSENSFNMTSVDLDQHVQIIITFVEQIWQKQTQKRREGKAKTKQLNPKSQFNFSLVTPIMNSVHTEQDSQEQNHHEQLNEHQIQVLFREVFLNQSNTESNHRKASQTSLENVNHELEKIIIDASHYFFIECKQDQLMWLLLSPQILRKFLLTLKASNQEYLKQGNIHKLQNNILLPSYQFSILKQDLVQIFAQNFQTLLIHYQVLDIKLKDLSSELKIYLKEKDPKFDVQKLDYIPLREGGVIKEAREAISRKIDFYRSGEFTKKSKLDGTALSKIFNTKKTIQGEENDLERNQEILLKGLVKLVQPELNAQKEMFLLEETQMNDEQLLQIKNFFRGKLAHKQEPSILANKKAQEELKNKLNQKSTISEKDEFEEERDEIKGKLFDQWNTTQEQNAQRNLLPQEMEHLNEKKAQIKDVTQRLYGERGETAQTLKIMSMTTGILSDIDRLEKQPSPIEQPFLISNFKLQKKTMHRNLNKEISLPTLHFLKPTSAYFARRQQSQEQLRVMAQKKYDLIESGMAPPTCSTLALVRPKTDTNQQRKMKTTHQERQFQEKYLQKEQSDNVEKFYIRYGSQESSQQFLGYLMNKQGVKDTKQLGQITLQEFPFQFNYKKGTPQTDAYKSSGGGARPKSILVYPQQ